MLTVTTVRPNMVL